MPLLWVCIGVVVVAIAWALIAAYSGRPKPTNIDYSAPPPPPMAEFEMPETPKASTWHEGAKAGVSKNFGKGGIPTGVSRDAGGIAVKSAKDDDLEWLKNARPFEPRATKLNLDQDLEEVSEKT